MSFHRGIEETLSTSTDPKLALEDPNNSRPDFILDSVASLHGTGNEELLSNAKPQDGASVGGNKFPTRIGKDLDIVAVGSIKTPLFDIPDVHLVPGLGRTVVSVRKLARRGFAVTFGSESCSIKEESTGTIVGEGRMRKDDELYYLDYLRVPQS